MRAGLCLIALAPAAAFAADPPRAPDDPRDLLVIMPALNEVLENERSGKDIGWTNVATGRAGTIRVDRTYYRGQQPCRDYTRNTSGNGPGYEVRGTGCRVGKLNWSVEEARKDEPAAPAATAAAPAPAAPAAAAAPSVPAADPAAVAAPSGDPSARPPRKAPPPQPALRYGLPTRSQL